MIARAFWKLRQFSKLVIFKNAQAFWSYRSGSKQRPHALQVASLPIELSWFNVHSLKIGLFVSKHISYFQSLMDVQPLWHVDVYQQNVFCRGRNEAENHILNQNLFPFVSMWIQKNQNISVSRSDFNSRCRPGVSSSWMEFDFCYAIENSRSFNKFVYL